MLLERELLVDDFANFILDLLARHALERGQIDKVKQLPVNLDLERHGNIVVGI